MDSDTWLPPGWQDCPQDACGRYPQKPFPEFLKALTEWEDFDGAEFELGLALGIFPPEAQHSRDVKWVFWTDNGLGNFLVHGLDVLTHLGFLEHCVEEQQWRVRRST